VHTSNSNIQAEQIRRAIKRLHPRVLALAFAILFEITEACFGPRHRHFLEALARRAAEAYVSNGPSFRKRLDQALENRRLAPVDWWEVGHGG
jgi:hypothetical protein